MTPRSRWLLFLVSTPLVLLVSVGSMLRATTPAPQGAFPHPGVLNDVVQRITATYVEPPNMNEVMDGAMRGLTDALDPQSAYLSGEEVQAIDSKTPLPAGDTGLVVMSQYYLRILG